jgi:hypothetical protein
VTLAEALDIALEMLHDLDVYGSTDVSDVHDQEDIANTIKVLDALRKLLSETDAQA